jgi:hypothetical protein
MQIRIHVDITFGSWIRIRIRVKNWILSRIKSKFRRLKIPMKLWTLFKKAGGFVDHWSQIRITWMRSSIRIRVEMMRFRNPGSNCYVDIPLTPEYLS